MVRVVAENQRDKIFENVDIFTIIEEEYNNKKIQLAKLNKSTIISMWEIVGRVLKTEGSFVFSPVALYLALVLLAKLTDGNTCDQIIKVLKIEKNNLSNVYRGLECVASSDTQVVTSKISSSIWLNEKMKYNEDLLLQINKEVDLESYVGELGTAEMNKAIAEWISKTTEGMIDDILDIKTEKNSFLELFTTVYFSAVWENNFSEEDTAYDSFYLTNGEKNDCEFMKMWEDINYHKGLKFSAITKSLECGYDVLFILPNIGTSIDDLICNQECYELMKNGRLNTTKMMKVNVSIPKYDITTKFDLKNVMMDLGIYDIFDSKKSDFRPISDMKKLHLSKAIQNTKFKVEEKGVKAAACVEMGILYAGIPPV